jgi:hypothetical protein
MGRVHGDGSESFWDGADARQLFALDTLSPDHVLVYIEEGEAEQLRAAAKSGKLVCPVPGCPNPGFTTVGGSRRHHFRHLTKGARSHGGESFAHHTAKHLIGLWARTKYPEAMVSVDDERVESRQLPDVLITMGDGTRYAIEVQYSPMTATAWSERHRGYVDQGIHDVWILGHIGANLRRSRREENLGNPNPGPLHAAIHRAGLPLLWINPFKSLIGAGLLSLRDGERLATADPGSFWGRLDLAVEPLEHLRLVPGGATTPALDRHAADVDRERHERDRQEARWAQQARLDEDRRRRLTEEAAMREEAMRAAAERRQGLHDAKVEAWEEYCERVASRRMGGSIPDFLSKTSPREATIQVLLPVHWRTRIFLDHVDARIGETIQFSDIAALVAGGEDGMPGEIAGFVADFLLRLHRLGFIRLDTGDERTAPTQFVVLADVDRPPPPPPPRPPRQQIHEPAPSPPPRPALPPEPAERLSPLLRSLIGRPGRQRWQTEGLVYVRRRHLRRVPDLISDRGPYCDVLSVYPPLWHHLIINECIDGRIGERIDVSTAATALGFEGRPTQIVEQAISWYLDELRLWGLLCADHDGSYTVIADLHSPLPEAPASRHSIS